MDLLDMALQGFLGDKLLFTEAAFDDLVMHVLFEDVPPQIAHRESLAAQLTLNRLLMIGQHVLVKMLHLFATYLAVLIEPALLAFGVAICLNILLLRLIHNFKVQSNDTHCLW